jgi:hypothetical protein
MTDQKELLADTSISLATEFKLAGRKELASGVPYERADMQYHQRKPSTTQQAIVL